VVDVGEWLHNLGLGQYKAAFRENGVDAEVLPTLTGEELKDIGVSLIRHRRRLLDAIAALRLPATPAEAPAQVSPYPSSDCILTLIRWLSSEDKTRRSSSSGTTQIADGEENSPP